MTFIVNTNGRIDSIASSANTPKILSDLFINAIKSTQGLWKPIEIQKSFDFSGKLKLPAYPFLPNNRSDINCILFAPIYFGSGIH